MKNPPPHDPADAEAELNALGAALIEARAEIEALKTALQGGEQGPDPVLNLDEEARVTWVGAWPWPDPPTVGEPFAGCFDARSAASLDRLATWKWIGVGEHRLMLRSGRPVTLSVAPTAGGYRVAVRDVTLAAALDHATEQRRRMRAMAQLSGALARELTDPMSIVQAKIEFLLELNVSDPKEVNRHLTTALEHVRRVTATLRNLRLVGRSAGPASAPVLFDEVVREALDLMGPRSDRLLVRVEPANLAIGCDAALPARVCASLARQALEAAGRTPVHLHARRIRSQVVVRIGPSGRPTGEPLTEVDELALDRTLLASVGGSLVARRVGSVSQFEFTLPTPPKAKTGNARKKKPVLGRILVVGPTLAEVPRLLSNDGYVFEEAQSAADVLARLEGAECHAVIAELLPDERPSGFTLAKMVSEQFSATRVILVSEGEVLSSAALPSQYVPLRWPASRAELLTALGRRVRFDRTRGKR